MEKFEEAEFFSLQFLRTVSSYRQAIDFLAEDRVFP